MTEKPILFSGAMVRTILSGAKTQTRRALKPQPVPFRLADKTECVVSLLHIEGDPRPRITLGRVVTAQEIRWAAGDRLWVREQCRAEELPDGRDGVRYCADDEWKPTANTREAADRWADLNHYRGKCGAVVNSIHMPRWASRITLEVTAVRVERLQDITEADAIAEGAFKGKATGRVFNNVTEMRLGGPEWRNARDWYADLWDTINGRGSWDANPWVAVIEFRRVEAPDV